MGNSTASRLAVVRKDEVDRFERNGIWMIRANGKGVSLFTEKGMKHAPLTGWVWKIPKGSALPQGLKLVTDKNNPEHFFVTPIKDMPVDTYKGHLSELAVQSAKVYKKTGSLR